VKRGRHARDALVAAEHLAVHLAAGLGVLEIAGTAIEDAAPGTSSVSCNVKRVWGLPAVVGRRIDTLACLVIGLKAKALSFVDCGSAKAASDVKQRSWALRSPRHLPRPR